MNLAQFRDNAISLTRKTVYGVAVAASAFFGVNTAAVLTATPAQAGPNCVDAGVSPYGAPGRHYICDTRPESGALDWNNGHPDTAWIRRHPRCGNNPATVVAGNNTSRVPVNSNVPGFPLGRGQDRGGACDTGNQYGPRQTSQNTGVVVTPIPDRRITVTPLPPVVVSLGVRETVGLLARGRSIPANVVCIDLGNIRRSSNPPAAGHLPHGQIVLVTNTYGGQYPNGVLHIGGNNLVIGTDIPSGGTQGRQAFAMPRPACG